jgi:phosphatidylserine decarboxylase
MIFNNIFLDILVLLFIILFFLIFCFFLFWKFYFLREREVLIKQDDNLLYSPCDGKVLRIVKIDEPKKYREKKGKLGNVLTDIDYPSYVVSIFMSPLDIHHIYSPIDGFVKLVKHVSGKFHMAYDLDKSLENEKIEFVLNNKKLGDLKVILIAGFLARRCVSYVKKGDFLRKSQKLGLINLGSQITLVVPQSVMLKLKINQRVVAGESVIGKY